MPAQIYSVKKIKNTSRALLDIFQGGIFAFLFKPFAQAQNLGIYWILAFSKHGMN